MKRRPLRDDDDIAPPLGSPRARRDALGDYFDLTDEIREDEDDRHSASYQHPVE